MMSKERLYMMSLLCVLLLTLFDLMDCQSQPNPVPSPGCGQSSPGSGTFTIVHGGYTRIYIVHQPINYDTDTPIPFVFNFHGYTGTAQGMRNYWYGDANADLMNYLNIYVQSTNGANRNSWNDIGCAGSPGPDGPTCNYGTVSDVPIPSSCPQDQGPGANDGYCNWCNCEANDVEFIDYLGAIIEQNYCIDVSREYALGYSQGGMMTHTVGCQLNGRFAAIAPCFVISL